MSTSSSFPTVPSLSNSKFETYKLAPLEEDVKTSGHALPGAAITQSRVHGKTLLSVREVQSRIKHDHLGRGWGSWFCFVDEEWAVWAVKIDETFQPVFSSLGSIPTPIPSANSPPAEYPSIWSLSPTTYLLSDGHGRVYPLSVQPSADSLSVSSLGPAFELVAPGSDDLLPFKVEWVGGDRNLLVSCVHRERDEQTGAFGKEKGWEVKLCRFVDDWTDPDSVGDARRLEIMWTVNGEDTPSYAHFSDGRFLLGSTGSYSLPPSATPDASATPPPPSFPPQAEFTWTQTSTAVTITFSLPKETPPKAIQPSLGAKSLSISLSGAPLPGFATRTWWDAIKPSDSTWTWDSSEGHLTIEVEKSNNKNRWTQLFQPSEFEPVEETLSIEESAAIRENLAKFTSSFEGGGEEGGIGVLQDKGGISSLMREEMDIDDEEMEEGEGASGRREIRWTWIQGREGGEGCLVSGEANVVAKKVKGGEVVIGEEMGWGGKAFGQDKNMPEILVKSTLDALLFRPPTASSSTDSTTSPFLHTKTFPALSYVISSKREVKYILHTPTTSTSSSPASVLVFSSPTTSASHGDLFVYYEAGGKTTARSGVVKLGGGDEEGALLGVKGVEVGGERVLVALCERRVVVIRGLL